VRGRHLTLSKNHYTDLLFPSAIGMMTNGTIAVPSRKSLNQESQ
jgi:hypothetical protein